MRGGPGPLTLAVRAGPAAAIAALPLSGAGAMSGVAAVRPWTAEPRGLAGPVPLLRAWRPPAAARAARRAAAARAMAVAVAVEAAASVARLTNREVGILPLRRLSLRARQRGADQPAVNGTVFFEMRLWLVGG